MSNPTPPTSPAIQSLKESIEKRELVVITGTGVSAGLTGNANQFSWSGLISDGLELTRRKGLITEEQLQSWKSHLLSEDIDELLGAAEFLTRKLEAPHGDLYARWLEATFKGAKPTNEDWISVLRSIHSANVPICTVNYDTLVDDVLDLSPVTLNDPTATARWMRREPGVLHLHGCWRYPKTCVLGIRDYEATLRDDIRDLIQRSIGSFKRLLFVGCGSTLDDPNFTALIRWLRAKMGAAAPQHFALIRNSEVSARHADANWRGFVDPIGYGDSYDEIVPFLHTIFSRSPNSSAGRIRRPAIRQPADEGGQLLEKYRSFLVKDCGQMTIEGIRADMEIGQRRFDLERLFVPLDVAPCPPEFRKNDKHAAEKLRKWKERNPKSYPFGRVFGKAKHIALLALPGGGKTLLLKRLAVAYANPARRTATSDALPALSLTPVLIRCREWREHIRKPIVTLLQSIPEITGQPELVGFFASLSPLLRDGRVLLLIDGLDEIHVDADRTTFVEHLEAFLEDYPKIRLVVTSREAGFSLVAPCLSRFCQRWRIAPLSDHAIRLLCEYWRRLMIGDSPAAIAETNDVVTHLLSRDSLRRLAENPLLLTMLLVVKHGAGRLPPDRVSLYERAVEVLLDTWNIKGHDSLNLKEAVPQLACVAFQLLKAGKQTATERELLKLLESAREDVPKVRLYAKDSPSEFLKRVELRSSLLLEAGHQVESGRTVPFYQFRHLTFQEYLAAVAIAEGHYVGYSNRDTILKPLSGYLTSPGWKEVVPMAAVLARKQAEPLMVELIRQARALKSRRERRSHAKYRPMSRMPPPVARLIQCLVEEAEAAPKTLSEALKLIAFFADRGDGQEEWRALSKGPYGPELARHAWSNFSTLESESAWRTCATINAAGWGKPLIVDRQPDAELIALLENSDAETAARGLFVITGTLLNSLSLRGELTGANGSGAAELRKRTEVLLVSTSRPLRNAAMWAWILLTYDMKKLFFLSHPILNSLVDAWTGKEPEAFRNGAGTVLWTQLGMRREAWKPTLSAMSIRKVKRVLVAKPLGPEYGAALLVAFHAPGVCPNAKLRVLLKRYQRHYTGPRVPSAIDGMLKQLRHRS